MANDWHELTDLTGDLGGLRLERLEVNGGTNHVNLVLPRPQGTVPIRLGGVASSVPPCRLRASPTDEATTSMRAPVRTNAGSSAVTITAALSILVYALVDVIRMPNDASFKTGTQLIWILVILLAQGIGAIVYLIIGRPPGGATGARERFDQLQQQPPPTPV